MKVLRNNHSNFQVGKHKRYSEDCRESGVMAANANYYYFKIITIKNSANDQIERKFDYNATVVAAIKESILPVIAFIFFKIMDFISTASGFEMQRRIHEMQRRPSLCKGQSKGL